MEKISDLFFEIGYKVDSTGFKKAENGLKGIKTGAKKGASEVGLLEGQMGSLIKRGAGILSVGYAVKKTTDLIVNTTNAYGEFDDSLRKTGAKIGVTELQLKDLGNATKKVALEFNSTGKAVSDAQEFLALAGYTLEEIKAASPTVVAAQKATGESMKLVSDIATDTGSAYGFAADKLDYATDRMVYTTNKFNTNFGQLGEAMKYVAPIAENTGMEFSDLNAYIGVLANSGIKGTQAGTALRASFLRLQAPVGGAQKQLKKYNINLFDQNKKFIGINKAMLKIEKATKKMNGQQKAMFMQQVFGTEAMSAMNIVFKEGIGNIVDYGNAIDDLSNGKTKEMAKFMEAGYGGMKRSFESEKDGLRLVLGEIFEPVAYDFVKILRDGTKDIRTGLEEEKSTASKFVSGLWSYTKKGAALAGDFMYNTGEILNMATGGVFKAIPETTLGFVGKNIVEEGEMSQNIQKFERKRLELYGDKNLIDLNTEQQKEYFQKLHPEWEMKKDLTAEEIVKRRNANYLETSDLQLGDYMKQFLYSGITELPKIYNIDKDKYTDKQNENRRKENERVMNELYKTTALGEAARLSLNLSELNKNSSALIVKEPPKVEVTVNGGIFTSQDSIDGLAELIDEKVQEAYKKNWNSTLKFENSLMGGRGE